jgi:hypothetical protein
MCYSAGKSLVTIATTGRQPDSGEILSKELLADHRALFGDQIPLAIALHEDVGLAVLLPGDRHVLVS